MNHFEITDGVLWKGVTGLPQATHWLHYDDGGCVKGKGRETIRTINH